MRDRLNIVKVDTFFGTQCKNCGSTLRYSNGGHCVHCKKQRSLREAGIDSADAAALRRRRAIEAHQARNQEEDLKPYYNYD